MRSGPAYLRVPIIETVEWGEWLDEQLAEVPDRRDIKMLEADGEEEGKWYVYTFGAQPEAMEQVARETLESKSVQVAVTGTNEVTVSVPAKSGWIKLVGPAEHAYDRVMKDLAKEFSDTYGSWWAKPDGQGCSSSRATTTVATHGCSKRRGQPLRRGPRRSLHPRSQGVDSRGEEAARTNLQAVIDQVGEHLGHA